MNAKKLMNLGGWAALLVAGSLVGYAIVADIPQKAKEAKQRQEEFQRRHFALKVEGSQATVTPEKIEIPASSVELFFKGDKRPATLANGFWIMSNVSHVYTCVQTTQFDCYEVIAEEKSIVALKEKAKNGLELQSDQISKNAWLSFVQWDKKTNELSLGEKVLIRAVISLL